MKTFTNPSNSPVIGEFTYEGCRYAGIASGLTFSILSDGLAGYLMSAFPWLVESSTTAPIADNEFCCSKCNKDCGSKFMKERHEKVCNAKPQGLATILKPSYIFWNYINLDKTQLSEDQLLPDSVKDNKVNQVEEGFTLKEVSEPAPGKEGTAMIGKHLQKVVTDRDNVDWYGDGPQDDTP